MNEILFGNDTTETDTGTEKGGGIISDCHETEFLKPAPVFGASFEVDTDFQKLFFAIES